MNLDGLRNFDCFDIYAWAFILRSLRQMQYDNQYAKAIFFFSLVSSIYFMWLFLLTCTYVKISISYQDLKQFCMLKNIQYSKNISVSYMSMSIISYLFDVGF